MKKIFVGAFLVLALLLIIAYILIFIEYGIGYLAIIPVASAVLCLACAFILKEAAKKSKNTPKYTAIQLKNLNKAAEDDRRIIAENSKNEALAKEEYNKRLPLEINKNKQTLNVKAEELHTLAESLKSHLQTFTEMDCLSEKIKP